MKYVIFNPITGVHAECDTPDEAREAQKAVLKDYVCSSVVGMFSCNLQIPNDDGTVTWKTYDLGLEKCLDELIEEAVTTSILNFFHHGIPISEEVIKEVLVREGLITEEQAYDLEPNDPSS